MGCDPLAIAAAWHWDAPGVATGVAFFFFVAGLIFRVVLGMGQFTHAHADNHHIAEEPHIQVSRVIYNDEQVK